MTVDPLDDEIMDLLSVRTMNCLTNLCHERGLPRTVASFRTFSDADVLRTWGFGRKSLEEFRDVVGPGPEKPRSESRAHSIDQMVRDLRKAGWTCLPPGFGLAGQ